MSASEVGDAAGDEGSKHAWLQVFYCWIWQWLEILSIILFFKKLRVVFVGPFIEEAFYLFIVLCIRLFKSENLQSLRRPSSSTHNHLNYAVVFFFGNRILKVIQIPFVQVHKHHQYDNNNNWALCVCARLGACVYVGGVTSNQRKEEFLHWMNSCCAKQTQNKPPG